MDRIEAMFGQIELFQTVQKKKWVKSSQSTIQSTIVNQPIHQSKPNHQTNPSIQANQSIHQQPTSNAARGSLLLLLLLLSRRSRKNRSASDARNWRCKVHCSSVQAVWKMHVLCGWKNGKKWWSKECSFVRLKRVKTNIIKSIKTTNQKSIKNLIKKI